MLEYTFFGLITNQTFQSRRVKPLQYKRGHRTYSQVPIFICQLHNLCLKSFALLHELPCFSIIKWNTMWFWHRSILLRCVQYWGGFACIYIILQTSRMIWEFTYLEKNHPQLKSQTMKLLIQFNEAYIYSKLNRFSDSSILISSSIKPRDDCTVYLVLHSTETQINTLAA